MRHPTPLTQSPDPRSSYHITTPHKTLTQCIGHDIGQEAFSTLLVIAHGEVQP